MDNDSPSPHHFALIAAIFEGGLAFVAVGLGWLLGQAPLSTFQWDWLAGCEGALAVLPPLVVLWLCLKVPLGPFVRILRVIDEVLVPMFRQLEVQELAIIAILAGVGEEMLFRGVVQQTTAAWIGGPAGPWVALAVAALLFALLHPITPLYAVLAGLIGLYLGWLWLATANLLAPIVAHAGYDFVALVYLTKIRSRKHTAAAEPT